MNENVILKEDAIINRIYKMSDTKVMIDRCLLGIHGMETKRLKEAVRPNTNRFPDDFMSEMNKEAFANWGSQIVTSNAEKMKWRYARFC